MPKRALWVTVFLTVTAVAVGMELWASVHHSPDAPTWTALTVRFVPQALATAAVIALVGWLPGHFQHAYQTTGGGRMSKLSPYAKFVVALVGAALTAAQATLPLTPTQHAWVTIGLAVVSAVAVYTVPNAPVAAPNVRRRAHTGQS